VSEGDTEMARGMFHGIDGDGALLVRSLDGLVERIISGDVRVV
jgi:biotin-(acetyl-CoA carboxylase) ligase